MEDIPAAVNRAQTALGESLQIELQPHIGTHPHLQQLLIAQMIALGGEKQILLSHGSRRLGGNQSAAEIAARTEAAIAYWSMSPTLAERVARLAAVGYRQIAIQPYFLFPGGIVDAIAREVKKLQQQFPQLELILGQPIGWQSLLEAIAISYG
jgi:sirohydrochlorin ferrochelatase